MLEHLKHLRFVHNTQTIVCLTVVYFVWSSWTSGTELLSDLKGFLLTAQVTRQVVENPEHHPILAPAIRNYRTLLNRELSNAIGHRVTAVAPSKIQSVTSLPEESASIGTQWRELQGHQWILQTLGTSQESLTDVRVWLDRWRGCQPYLERGLRALRKRPRRDLRRRPGQGLRRYSGRPPSSAEIRELTTPVVDLVVTGWPENSNFVSATVAVVVYVPARHRSLHPCRRDAAEVPDPGNFTRDDEWGLFVERKTFGSYRFVVRIDTIRLPPSTFDRYPYLEQALNTIGEFTPSEALDWAKKQQVARIRGQDPRFFGTNIRGEHLGYVGPVVIFLLHVYLLITLHSLLGYVQRESRPPGSPTWLATMKLTWPRLFSFLTLAGCPTVAVGLALWRLTGIHPMGLVLWPSLLFVLGIWIVVLAQRLGVDSDAEV